jgi:hypothetical protein
LNVRWKYASTSNPHEVTELSCGTLEVSMYCITSKETQKIFPRILQDWRHGTITSLSTNRDSTDTARKHTYITTCAAGKLLQITAGADRVALITTPTPLPHPFTAGARLQLSPGAMRGRATPWPTIPHSFFTPTRRTDTNNSSWLVPIARPPSRCNRNLVTRQLPLDLLGQFRKSSYVVRLPHLTYHCSHFAVIQLAARGQCEANDPF